MRKISTKPHRAICSGRRRRRLSRRAALVPGLCNLVIFLLLTFVYPLDKNRLRKTPGVCRKSKPLPLGS